MNMQVSIRQAATRYSVNYDTLYRVASRHPEAFGTHRQLVIGQPKELWFLDDESAGFQTWLTKYRKKQDKKTSFSDGSEIALQNA